MAAPLLILKTGSTYPEIASGHGDFEDWFIRIIESCGAAYEVVDATVPFAADLTRFSGAILTGSLASAYWDEPWIGTIADWIRRAVRSGKPILGVCFGHQMLGRALGGTVRRCTNGLELGTVEIHLTGEGKSDPLFEGLPDTFQAQETHVDEVVTPPPGAHVLAKNSHSAIQAMACGEDVWGVQFHPEITDEIMRSLILDLNTKGKLRESDSLLSDIRPTPVAEGILKRFISLATDS
ncbi:MAG TPA: glutamine amidotransferase [Thermoanaerobaculia bacterium]|nr:glutamine amidotransferase [Thermoanaerobaculia bacterium]HUM30584.1 glutamine amidotransferase [Thermoanaerobaculia bacterium]HXK68776.1 glutamine amidotransferase [Thermoanaerobaculia bacterium]